MKKPENLEGCLTGSFALIATLLLTAFIIVGCSATRQVTQLVEHVQKDTLYLSNVQYDSIYVFKDRFLDRSRDTVYLKDVSVEYRYRMIHDTVRVVQRDSIPYEVTVTEIKEITRPLTLYDKTCRACFWFLIGIIGFCIIRFLLKLRRL